MKKTSLTYQLADGFVHDWLILGPCDMPRTDRPMAGETELAFRRRLLAAGDRTQPDFDAITELDRFTCPGNGEARYWEAAHCEADHLLDFSGTFSTYTVRRVWAHTILNSSARQEVTLHLYATCPVTLWLNDKPIRLAADQPDQSDLADLADQTLRTFTQSVTLRQRDNRLLIRLEQIAIGDAALAFGLRIAGTQAAPVRSKLTTLTLRPQERLAVEHAYQFPYLDRAVLTPDDTPHMVSPDDTPGAFESMVRMETPEGWIYGESYGSVRPAAQIPGVHAIQLPSGPMRAVLMPPATLYYEANLRARRVHHFWVANRPFSQAADTDYSKAMGDVLREAARAGNVFGELGQMAADWWATVDAKNIRAGIERVKRREVGCLIELLGLLSMKQRMASHSKFPADVLDELDAAVLGFDYRGADLPGPALSAAEQIVLYTCQVLAGQIYPRHKFACSERTGRQEREEGEGRAAAWLATHGRTTFGDWNTQTDLIVAALVHLVDLAKHDALLDHAAVMLDKILFNIAVHSFRGSFGGSRDRADVATLRSARFAAEAAIGRMLWGMGGPQGGLIAGISLILAGRSYELPAIIHAIATDTETEVWARSRQAAAGTEVNTVVYRTADFMLSSAQDYRPGARGAREHIWQATMSPEALVFTTHPGSFAQADGRDAGWWRGNASLPRVAQWKDALIALYDLPAGDWLGFTHAYFPTYAFDEYLFDDGWAFARTGDAYLALYASAGFTFMRRGPDAWRELRAEGPRHVWLCQLGARDTDSSFENFRQHVLAQKPQIEGLHVIWRTIRGEELEFDWQGPLRRNGKEEPITGFKHYEGDFGLAEYPAETMDISYGAEIMRLHVA